MKQKLFAFGDDFNIRDESGKDVFFVDGKMLSLGDRLSFQDMRGNELAFIRQKLLSWGPKYDIFRMNYTRRATATDVTIEAEATANLADPGSWSPDGITQTMVSDEEPIQLWEATIPVSDGRNFMRLKITHP